ncbi:MAG TPA: hypothetical protein EYQ36_06745, partial [Sulfitobacter sp.]|nr:hypothetical protein [Sulfitobacter sp.]
MPADEPVVSSTMTGASTIGSASEPAKAVDAARKVGVRVINMSYGDNRNPVLSSPGIVDFNTIAHKKNKNIVFVKSAGNLGANLWSWQSKGAAFDASKDLKNFIIVGAVDKKK